MPADTCLICQRIHAIQTHANAHFVCELETGYVVMGDHQHFRGYTLFLCKKHVEELHFLPKDVLQKHLAELALVYQAVYRAFAPDKMNCELLGNGDAHLHWHLFPRVAGDTPQPGPVWCLPREEMYSDAKRPTPAELSAMKAALKREIDGLLEARVEK